MRAMRIFRSYALPLFIITRKFWLRLAALKFLPFLDAEMFLICSWFLEYLDGNIFQWISWVELICTKMQHACLVFCSLTSYIQSDGPSTFIFSWYSSGLWKYQPQLVLILFVKSGIKPRLVLLQNYSSTYVLKYNSTFAMISTVQHAKPHSLHQQGIKGYWWLLKWNESVWKRERALRKILDKQGNRKKSNNVNNDYSCSKDETDGTENRIRRRTRSPKIYSVSSKYKQHLSAIYSYIIYLIYLTPQPISFGRWIERKNKMTTTAYSTYGWYLLLWTLRLMNR